MSGLIRSFGIPHNLPAPHRQPPSGPGPAPVAVPDKPPAPAQGHRTKYVVLVCTLAATYHDRRRGATEAAEAEWRITLRRADQREGVSSPGTPQMRYVYWVVQPAGKPAPCHPGATLELDPRLVDVEPNS